MSLEALEQNGINANNIYTSLKMITATKGIPFDTPKETFEQELIECFNFDEFVSSEENLPGTKWIRIVKKGEGKSYKLKNIKLSKLLIFLGVCMSTSTSIASGKTIAIIPSVINFVKSFLDMIAIPISKNETELLLSISQSHIPLEDDSLQLFMKNTIHSKQSEQKIRESLQGLIDKKIVTVENGKIYIVEKISLS